MRGAGDATPVGLGHCGSRARLAVRAAAFCCALCCVVCVAGIASGRAVGASDPIGTVPSIGTGDPIGTDSPIGIHAMLQLNDPPSFMNSMFAEAAKLGASEIRLDVPPAVVLDDPGDAPHFSGLDEVMALSRRYDLPVVADLVSIPWWIADCRTSGTNMTLCGTDDLRGYEAAITEIVSHADPVIHDWEIWNEPDTSRSFSGTPQQYAWMLSSAYYAIKQVDPQDRVLLGGISSISGMGWLGQVFATPGADAIQAFDIANVHERAPLDAVAPDIQSWKRFFAARGFDGPLWVTEHGYPSNPAYQYDSAFDAGQFSQAAYLSASVPSMIDAGASMVFVTERDNLGGQFASEGLLRGDVADPPVADPEILEKPSYSAVWALADCYAESGRDCPGPAPAATSPSLRIPATEPGSSTVSAISVVDLGNGPVQLGRAVVVAGRAKHLRVRPGGCSAQILEPDQTCTVSVRFAPAAGGDVASTLRLSSDDGPLAVPITAVAPSVSSLAASELPDARHAPNRRVLGGRRLSLELRNPLWAPVRVGKAWLSGAGSRRFEIESNRCVHVLLDPHAECRLVVAVSPSRPAGGRVALVLAGEGRPLNLTLPAVPG